MYFGHDKLVELVDKGVIEGVTPEMIGPESIDVTLHHKILREKPCAHTIDVGSGVMADKYEVNLIAGPIIIQPKEWFIGLTEQVFNLPLNIAAEFELCSTEAQQFLEAPNSRRIHPGFSESRLAVELKNGANHQYFTVRAGMRIGQIYLMPAELVSEDKSYKSVGRYNNRQSFNITI